MESETPLILFDTHAHYDDDRFDEDREALLTALPGEGIRFVVNIGSDQISLNACKELAERYDHVYCALGLHPSEVEDADEKEVMAQLKKDALETPKVLAIGEIGLDYHWPEPAPELQRHWFRRQLQLAGEVNKPVVIHSRDAAGDTISILREEHAEQLGGVIHCYSYGKEEAGDYLDLGFYFGIGGVVTFKNFRALKEALEIIPLERIVLETDTPYLAPEPFRGKRNDSRNLYFVVRALAELKDTTPEEVARITFENAKTLYRMGEINGTGETGGAHGSC